MSRRVVPLESRAAAHRVLFAMALAAGCGGAASSTGPVSPVRPACKLAEQFLEGRCQPVAGRTHLEAGRAALAKFEVEAATSAFDAAAKAGPLDYDSNVALWEQRGIAAAYADDEPAALRAFDILLTLDPGHLLSYTLSPRATFVFEKARVAAARAKPPAVQLTWRRDARIGDPLPVDVEVLVDPKQHLSRATLLMRSRGEPSWRAIDFPLKPPGSYQRVTLPATSGTRPATLELYLRAFDGSSNEVLRWASPEAPRELALRYDPPEPWHRKWWVRATAGGVLAVATGIIVYAVTREPPGSVDGDVVVE
jgi:tetratricopeptide (TPR) repeat protein